MEFFLPLQKLLLRLHEHPEARSMVLASIWGGAAAVLVLAGILAYFFRKYCTFVAKSVLRHPGRSALTAVSIMVLVFVVTLVWSFLSILDLAMTEQSKDLKAIVTERLQIPSQMPFAYAATLEKGAARGDRPGDYEVPAKDSMTWQFFGGTIDPTKEGWDFFMFFFAMEPHKIRSMMDDLDMMDPALEDALAANKRGALLGKGRLARLNKRVGDRFTVTSYNLKGLALEFEIVGVLPEGRYDMSAIMNRDYLNDALDVYNRDHPSKDSPTTRSLSLVWLRVPDDDVFRKVAGQVMTSPEYTSPTVKCETAASGIATWLAPYKDLLWGLKVFLMPALLVTMAMIMANAIAIGVRERRTEIAVLKVLGYGPGRILAFVLGEALLIGGGAGLLSAGLSYLLIHVVLGGIKFPIAFIPMFDIYLDAIWWGLLVGALTALVGSAVPAWNACRVRVTDVFAKVA